MRNYLAPLLAATILSGCASPFAQRVSYDHSVKGAPGTISLSDPKLYTREALIAERAKDVTWYEKLINDSEDPTKVQFKPELIRELEQISAFAAAVGVKYDPMSAASFRRNQATGEVQEQIDLLKLQLQLEQLQRDAALFREGFANQTVPVNTNANTLGTGGNSSTAPITVSSADQLKAAIDKLLLNLTTSLGTKWDPLVASPVTATPFDDFRDRSAYRDLIKSARNAASLDQLHDSANARLLRLNFQASILPNAKYNRHLGAVQIRVVPGAAKPSASFLNDYLVHLNTDLDYRDLGGAFRPERIAPFEASGAFRSISVGTVNLLLPVLVDARGAEQDPDVILLRAFSAPAAANDLATFDSARAALPAVDTATRTQNLIAACSDPTDNDAAENIERALILSHDLSLSRSYWLLADKVARRFGGQPVMTPEVQAKFARSETFREALRAEMQAIDACKPMLEHMDAAPQWKAMMKPVPTGSEAVRIYDIGPREQVQQISTTARAANSLALAAAMAGSIPGQGVGAEAAASYSRQAMGRATALERLPSVVGYSVAGDGVFGWVLGPRAVVNPKGRVEIEQMLKPYDLAVDLSVPGWWETLDLEVVTVWGPAPDLMAGGRLLPGKKAEARPIHIPLARTAGDFDALTEFFLGAQGRDMPMDIVSKGPINTCTAATLLVRGPNLWRAQRALVLGQIIERDKLMITPDMQGLFIRVEPIAKVPNIDPDPMLYVMTPVGTAKAPVTYMSEPSGDGCKTGTRQDAANPDAVSVSKVDPAAFAVPSNVVLEISGKNLKKVSQVALSTKRVKANVLSDELLTADFDTAATDALGTSDQTSVRLFDKDGKLLATRTVRTERTR